jgi:hypothetical protein
MGHVTSKMTERYFDPLADNGAGTGAVASLLGVEDGKAETPPETTSVKMGPGLTLDDDKPFRPPSEMLAALTERYSNIAIGKILDVCRFQSGWASLFRTSGEQLTGCGVSHPATRREG